MSFIEAVIQKVSVVVKGKKATEHRGVIPCPATESNVTLADCQRCKHYGGHLLSGVECGHKKASELLADAVHLLEECPLSKRPGQPCVADTCPMWMDLKDFHGCALLLAKGSLQKVFSNLLEQIKKAAEMPDRQDKKEDTVRENP